MRRPNSLVFAPFGMLTSTLSIPVEGVFGVMVKLLLVLAGMAISVQAAPRSVVYWNVWVVSSFDSLRRLKVKMKFVPEASRSGRMDMSE